MSSSLEQGVGKTKTQSENVASSASQMSESIDSIAASSEEMNSNVNQVSSSAEELRWKNMGKCCKCH